jgi:hypothetical protein
MMILISSRTVTGSSPFKFLHSLVDERIVLQLATNELGVVPGDPNFVESRLAFMSAFHGWKMTSVL